MDTDNMDAKNMDADNMDTDTMDTDMTEAGNAVHERWLWFTEVAGQPAEIECCDDDACIECAGATPVGILEESAAA